MNRTLKLTPQLALNKPSLKKLFITLEMIFLIFVAALVFFMYGNLLIEFIRLLITGKIKPNLLYLWIYKPSNGLDWSKELILLSIVPMLILSIYKKSKAALGALLFSFVYIAISLATYTAAGVLMLRIFGPLYYFNIMTLTTQRANITLLIFMLLSLAIISFPYKLSLELINVQNYEIRHPEKYFQLIYNLFTTTMSLQ